MAPRGTPAPAVERLHAEIGRILEAPRTQETMARGGAYPMVMSIAKFDAFLRRDIDRQGEWIHGRHHARLARWRLAAAARKAKLRANEGNAWSSSA